MHFGRRKPRFVNTPLPSNQRKYAILATTFVGFVALALLISCAVLPPEPVSLGEQPAKYILTFGDASLGQRVMIDEGSFEKALGRDSTNVALAPKWTTSLTKKMTSSGQEEDVRTAKPVPAPPDTVTIAHLMINQTTGSGEPCTLHVTQKVGLNSLARVKAVLATLKKPE